MFRRSTLKCLSLSLVLTGSLLRALPAEDLSLASPTDKASYGVGVEMARNFKRQGIEINPDMVLRGLKDGLSGERLLFSEKELQKNQSDLLGEVRRRQASNQKQAGDVNRLAGDAFFATNKTAQGIVALPSGLQYRVLTAGTGQRPVEGNIIDCRYRGTVLDGTEFDSSEAGKTASMKVKSGPGMPSGLTEAIKLMPTGSHWQIFIPGRLGYGLQGAGRVIGPNATLVYDFELVAVH